jgi:hypothetical protein
VVITNLVLRDVQIQGGIAPSVFLCDAAAPCEGVTLERVVRTGWPMVGSPSPFPPFPLLSVCPARTVPQPPGSVQYASSTHFRTLFANIEPQ